MSYNAVPLIMMGIYLFIYLQTITVESVETFWNLKWWNSCIKQYGNTIVT